MEPRWNQYPRNKSRCWSLQRFKKKYAEEPADHALGRSRGGFGTKIHLLTDAVGTPLTFELSPGQTHDSKYCESVIERVKIQTRKGPPRTRPKGLAGDKAYTNKRIRGYLRKRGINIIIPRKSNERRRGPFNKQAYRKRHVVENCIGWLKESRRITTRFDKLAISFGAFVTLAILLRYFRIGF